MKSRDLKYAVIIVLISIISGGIYYLRLSNRHQAIVKTTINHKLGLVDNSWNIKSSSDHISLVSPTLVIDNIYKSMEGPNVTRSFQLDRSKQELYWITSFETRAKNTDETEELSKDFICHTNIDIYQGEHYSRWGLNARIGLQYPRLTSMSNGIEAYELPEGFGFPVFSDENLFLSTQALNHNIDNKTFSIKHEVRIGYKKQDVRMKPLMSKTTFIMLPYDAEEPFKGPTSSNPKLCLPVETKNHSYNNEKGESLSGHWVIFPGKASYSFDVTDQLSLKDSTSMHMIAAHIHPFAESLAFRDKTIDSTLYISKAINHENKIGLKKVSYFSSMEGIMLYPDHNYELILKVNNTSSSNQDMMASMFVFLYDKEMDARIKAHASYQN